MGFLLYLPLIKKPHQNAEALVPGMGVEPKPYYLIIHFISLLLTFYLKINTAKDYKGKYGKVK